MAWINNKHETLSSTSDTMDATSMTASEFGMFLNHALPSGGDTQTNYSVNGVDSGGKYAFRTQKNQGSATTSDDQDNVTYDVGGETYDKLSITFACDIAGEEKLFIGFGMSRKEAGAGNAPTRANINWKYETTSARVTSVRDDTSSQSGTYEVGSNLSVIGDGGATQTDKEKLTNVPVGTRFEETDTRKIYRYDENKLNYEDVTYNTSNDEDVTISGNTVTKGSAGAQWEHGFARSTQSISPSTGGGEVKFTMSRLYAMGGLDKGTAWSGSGTTYPTVEYALYYHSVYESGTDRSDHTTSTDAHIYKITMDSAGLVKYYVDSTLVHTSTVTATNDEYYFAAMPYDTSDFVTAEIKRPDNKFYWWYNGTNWLGGN